MLPLYVPVSFMSMQLQWGAVAVRGGSLSKLFISILRESVAAGGRVVHEYVHLC